jgi:negative regulator of replication initiation
MIWKMTAIDLDSDLVAFLRENERVTGVTPSDYVRAKLRGQQSVGLASLVEDEATCAGLVTRANTALSAFLRVLSSAAVKYPEVFHHISKVSGRTRTYFSTRAKDIEDSGNSTYPVSIPGTEWLVLSNTSTRDKRKILERVFQALGCLERDSHAWLADFDRAVTEDEAPLKAVVRPPSEDSDIKI